MKKIKRPVKAITNPQSRLDVVMSDIRAKIKAQGEQEDGGVSQAFLGYLVGREPREEFFSLCDIITINLEMFGDKSFRKRFKKVSGFETQILGTQKLIDLYSLFASLSHWKIDRYLQLQRFSKGFKTVYSEAEFDALEEMYVEEHGKNDELILVRDEIRSASAIAEPFDELPF